MIFAGFDLLSLAVCIQKAQLPQRDRVTHYVSKYVSRGMGVTKRFVSNSKSDLQGHSRALAMVPF